MGQVWHESSGAGRLGQVWHESSAAGRLGFLGRLRFLSPKKSYLDRPAFNPSPHLLDIGGHILVPERLDVHGPLVGVTVLLPLLTEILTHVPVHDRLGRILLEHC